MIFRITDYVGYGLTGLGASVYAGAAFLAQAMPSNTDGSVGYGGWILGMFGLLTLVVNKHYADRHEDRQMRRESDQSNEKLKQAEEKLREATEQKIQATTQLESLKVQIEQMKGKFAQLDENTARIGEVSAAQDELKRLGVLAESDDASDQNIFPHVLVVDDDVDASIALSRMFKALGYTVHVAVTTPDAIRKVNKYAPSIVITDLLLPDGSGLDVARAAIAKLSACRVILITGATDSSDLGAAMSAGVEKIFTKPFEFDELIQVVEGKNSTTIHPKEPKFHA